MRPGSLHAIARACLATAHSRRPVGCRPRTLVDYASIAALTAYAMSNQPGRV